MKISLLILSLILLITTNIAFAEVSDFVFLQGKVSNSFDAEKVKVVDGLGQVYFLPRRVFPKDFKLKQGAPFAFDVKERDLASVKLIEK